MWVGRPLSVKTSIRLSLLGMILAVTAAAVIAHEFHRRRDVNEAEHERSLSLASAIAGQLNEAARLSRAAVADRCRSLLELPWVLGVAVWDEDAQPLHEAFVAPAWGEVLRGGRPDRLLLPHVVSVHLAESSERPGGLASLVYSPLHGRVLGPGPTDFGLLVRAGPAQSGLAGLANAHLWGFHLPVTLTAATALILGAWWLRREVVRPLRFLARVANSEELIDHSPDPCERYLELAEIARALASLQENASDWRQRAELIERRVGTQIAQETRRITQDLRQIQKESLRDPLTRVYNRRFLEKQFPLIFDAQKNSQQDLSVMMLDLDHFKLLNDSVGHAAGDEVLRFLGELLQLCLRPEDFAVRYGGDEFVVVLPGVKKDDARAVARRIVAMFVQRAKMMVQVKPPPALTIGVASLCGDSPSTPAELMTQADRSLLAAKRARQGAARRKQADSLAASRRGAIERAESTATPSGTPS